MCCLTIGCLCWLSVFCFSLLYAVALVWVELGVLVGILCLCDFVCGFVWIA